ncbi:MULTISPECIES: YiiX/YebB-like N1pC/P60 family cysteine hydrolase [unclassified Pseudomonas]|uniref:YiiX/YebB-like N1pC/P60 family cysteine hydrolase n=1 Tax=unclassified Pseudomonas TaxID=196821 RepID=UPI00244C8DB1|nr:MULTISPECIES: YiiX/YebB-like N1pC/P60 family cysteine hydrolase [unclassified Pseudomonas]MDG9922426.1 YiiX/YebB-like N1pC/P60 family cysteine hydrolase [Pseudomonas sp. GD04045]MDH0034376.1 YiiX/YebB-like N1pC/P60 family cysteine hydrolase [Pseudomonas sp. GD04019]
MRPGDILLVTGLAAHSKAIVYAQKPFYLKAKSSHVAVIYAENAIVHSIGGKGVHLAEMIDELKSCQPDWRVMRLRGLTEAQEEELQKSALYFQRQKYNRAIMMGGNKVSSFCSEFAVKAYKHAGIRIFNGKKASKILPADFDKEFDCQEAWADVTHEYSQHLVSWQEMLPLIRANFALQQVVLARRHIHSQYRKKIFDYFETHGSPNMQKAVAEVKENLREKRILHFWDENDAK